MGMGSPDIAEKGKNTQFRGDFAVEAQKKSVEARKANRMKERIFREDLLAKMGEEDWNKIIEGAMLRAKDNKQDLELLLAIIGQKPIDKQQLDINANVRTLEDELDSIDD